MEKLTEPLKDKAFVEEFFKQETAEDAQKFLASKGVDVPIDELNFATPIARRDRHTARQLQRRQTLRRSAQNVAGTLSAVSQ